MNQLELHKKIKELISKDPDSVNPEDVLGLISKNKDAKDYFFFNADERWIDWLWENGFLDAIKQKAEDPTRYSYKTPELEYLVRMAEKVPDKVANIILNVPISKETFNPEVIDRFTYICSLLPVEQLKKIVPKIRDKEWIRLMGVFNQWGFEYEKMFQKLAEIKDYESIITLAEAVLSVKREEDLEKEEFNRFIDSPFYFGDLSYTGVFKYLSEVSDEYLEKVFKLTIKIFGEIVVLFSKLYQREDEKVFNVYDDGILLDVDFFNLGTEDGLYLSERDNIGGLVGLIAIIAKRLIEEKSKQNEKEVIRIFKDYIGSFKDEKSPLPDSQATWRLRLFILSLCPEVFENELKKSFYRLFEVDNYYAIISGPEYFNALKAGFYVLSEVDKRDYVERVIEYFAQKEDREYGSRILSMIVDYLTEEEKEEIERKGFSIKPDYRPEPPIKFISEGYENQRAPLSCEEFSKLKIIEIAKKLANEWSPKRFFEEYRGKSEIYNSINVEGVSECLKQDIPKRLQEYIDNAIKFFDRGKIDPHYTYSYFRGVQEAIKNNRELAKTINWDGIIDLFDFIKKSGEVKHFVEREKSEELFNSFLVGWNDIHSAMVDVLQELLIEKDGFIVIDFNKYRDRILAILKYLLLYPDPTPEDEKLEKAKLKEYVSNKKDYILSDPFTLAINSVRGRAFQVFVFFVHNDGKQIKDDVKSIYEDVLNKENTRAIMFLFGYYISIFYYRDKSWLRELPPKIFPKEQNKKYFYTAALEGYLTNNLYKDIFLDKKFEELYERGIELKEEDFPKYQKHFKDPDEALATHLALAFVHFSEFDFKHRLFKKFWNSEKVKAHKSFISFIGRHTFSRQLAFEWIKENKIDVEKLKKFWDWALENCDSEALTGFGFWLSPEKNYLDAKWLAPRVYKTLEKTKGILDWDYGLTRSIIELIDADYQSSMHIVELYLLEGWVRNPDIKKRPLFLEDEWIEALRKLYKIADTKKTTEELINNLISEGGREFWKLEEILDNTK
jgi:hypothetical protein